MVYHFYFEYHSRIFRNPVANSEVSWNIYNEIQKHTPVTMKLIGNECPDNVTKDDLLIGMAGPLWMNTNRTDKIYAIMPWPGQRGFWYDTWLNDPRIQSGFDRAKKIIVLCGEYQYELTKQDPVLARWLPKMVRVDQGIDRDMYPLIKRSFNSPGQRKFFYFGLLTEAKGDDLTVRACDALGYKVFMTANTHNSNSVLPLDYVGNSDAKKWSLIAKEADFLIHPARCDCSPMNVLEAMSRGFIPIITPAAAVPVKGPIHTEPSYGFVVTSMKQAQDMSTEELLNRQKECLDAIDSHYNMKRFMQDIWNVIKDDVK